MRQLPELKDGDGQVRGPLTRHRLHAAFTRQWFAREAARPAFLALQQELGPCAVRLVPLFGRFTSELASRMQRPGVHADRAHQWRHTAFTVGTHATFLIVFFCTVESLPRNPRRTAGQKVPAGNAELGRPAASSLSRAPT